MVVFISGASGFIGNALVAALAARGHEIVAAARHPVRQIFPSERVRHVALDVANATDIERWRALIAGSDAVVNAVGIFRPTRHQSFARVHVELPRALFRACALDGITRVVQISALGADENAATDYHRSKRAGDEALLESIPTGVCAQPSLVYGRAGVSAGFFTALAALPLIPVPIRGEQKIQPIHLDDLVTALCRLLENDVGVTGRVPLVGPRPTTLRAFLADLRDAMQLGVARFIAVPAPLIGVAARIGNVLPSTLFDCDAWTMLERGNIADPALTTRLLGKPPRDPRQFIAAGEARDVRIEARLRLMLPVLRATVAFVWIATGIVSLGVYPVEASYALLARTGVAGAWAPWFLYGAALVDVTLGVLVFVLRGRRRRWLWRVQMALIVGYTAIISWALPEYWLHPYGPVTKNLPLLATLWLLDALEDIR